MRNGVFAAVLVLATGTTVAAEPPRRTLTFEDRVKAQKAIEQVYWNHRIWPKENPDPKPRLSAVMPDAAIRAKVEDYLRMSILLDSFWHQPITGDQLQAEITRMARQTKAPDTLRDLFAALHDDPFFIAECLARPTLARQRVERAFAIDTRIHGAQRAALAAKLKGVDDLAALARVDGDHAEITYVLDDGVTAESATFGRKDQAIHLTREEWNREIGRLATSFGASRIAGLLAVPVGRVSRLFDRGDRFASFAVKSRSEASVTVVSVSWVKRAYGEWARGVNDATTFNAKDFALPAQGYSTPTVALGGCTDDTWTPTAGSEVPDERYGHTAVWTGSEMIVWGGFGTDYSQTGGKYNPSTDSWTVSSLTAGTGTNVPQGRYLHSAVWTGSEMIVWGGDGRGGSLSSGGRYVPSTDSWAASSLTTGSGANVPEGRRKHTAVWTGTEMIVWGGYSNTGGNLNTGGRYNPSMDSWAVSSLTDGSGANVPAARTDHTAVWTGTEMIVWGGNRLNTGGRYNPSSDTWTDSSLATGAGTNVPEGRSDHTALWTGTEMIIWGGSGSNPFLNTGGRYDPATDTWVPSSLAGGSGANVPDGRNAHTALWSGSEMIVWGGYGAFPPYILNTGGRYSPATDTWSLSSLTSGVGASVPDGRSDHTAVWTGTEMIVWGGRNAFIGILNTGGRYNPLTDSWTESSLGAGEGANVPDARGVHTAVWTGTEMIVWGVGNKPGGRYVPVTDSWLASSLTTGSGARASVGRVGHTAVWTGTEMIVWGGDADFPNVNTGGRYNPSTDTWATSSLTTGSGANVPDGRSDHTAVWTGTEMIVWGGHSNSMGYLNSGGRYNPATDTWAASSLANGSGANVPAPRFWHTVVWTGSEMLIWGGYDGFSAVFGTGGRYNPSTDSWTASSLTNGYGANQATARFHHTAVWTGSEMIVWGGGGTAYLNTGGRYNPLTDTWAASSLSTGSGANVPGGRYLHSATWTGSEMIVWGGYTPFGLLNTGGRYNPFTDSWASSSLNDGSGANVPTARDSHTAVWTDTSDHRMIVWSGNPRTHTGALYCAVCTPLTSYKDLDGDGHGNPAVTQLSCSPLDGYVIAGDDCDDANAAVHPGATEVCNGIDDNCDDVIDDGGNVLCDDANVCTTDTCSSVAGCSHVDNVLRCDDGDACTTNDTCDGAGACAGGLAPNCDDSDACTADVCVPLSGCLPIHKTSNMDTTSFSSTRVDGRDLVVLAAAWNSCPTDPTPTRYNATANLDPLNPCIDGTDFHLFMTSFGRDCP